MPIANLSPIVIDREWESLSQRKSDNGGTAELRIILAARPDTADANLRRSVTESDDYLKV